MPPLLMSPADVCRLLGIGMTKFNQIVAKGGLSVIRLGGVRRVRREDLMTFLDALNTVTDSSTPHS